MYAINCSTGCFDAYQERVSELFVKVVCRFLFFVSCFISLGIIDSRRLLKWCIILAYNWLDCKMNDDWCSVFAFWSFVQKFGKQKPTYTYILCIEGFGCFVDPLKMDPLIKTNLQTEGKKIAKWCANFWCDGTNCVEYIHNVNAKRGKFETWEEPHWFLHIWQMAIHIWEHINSIIIEFHAWLLIECQFSISDTQIVCCCSCYDWNRAKCWKCGPISKS